MLAVCTHTGSPSAHGCTCFALCTTPTHLSPAAPHAHPHAPVAQEMDALRASASPDASEQEQRATHAAPHAAGSRVPSEESGTYQEELTLGRQLPITNEIRLCGHRKRVSALALDAAGARLLSGSFDGAVKMWDFAAMDTQFRSFRELEVEEGYPVNSVSYAPQGVCAPAASPCPAGDVPRQHELRTGEALRPRRVRRCAVCQGRHVPRGHERDEVSLGLGTSPFTPLMRPHFTSIRSHFSRQFTHTFSTANRQHFHTKLVPFPHKLIRTFSTR